jgi:hypothetical protein
VGGVWRWGVEEYTDLNLVKLEEICKQFVDFDEVHVISKLNITQ